MEEIIIDGVNVAGCEFYDNGCCRECDMRVPFYSDIDCYDKCNKNCYYKQLKRLEQENKMLQELKDEDSLRVVQLAKENAELKKENEEINNRMAEVTYRATGGRLSYSNYTLNAIEQAFYDQLEILSDQKAEEQIEDYKQALEEIKYAIQYPYKIDKSLSEHVVNKINEVLNEE